MFRLERIYGIGMILGVCGLILLIGILKKNAEKLKIATTETARQSERGIVDMDTLKATNESLISTLDEVMAIQREGREKRQAAEAELRNMEQELKGKLLQLHG